MDGWATGSLLATVLFQKKAWHCHRAPAWSYQLPCRVWGEQGCTSELIQSAAATAAVIGREPGFWNSHSPASPLDLYAFSSLAEPWLWAPPVCMSVLPALPACRIIVPPGGLQAVMLDYLCCPACLLLDSYCVRSVGVGTPHVWEEDSVTPSTPCISFVSAAGPCGRLAWGWVCLL